jgi:hypothetical protein
MNTVHEFKDGDYPVKLEQRANGKFRVTYGEQVSDQLNELEAAKEYGVCVMHSLCCAGKVDTVPDDFLNAVEG